MIHEFITFVCLCSHLLLTCIRSITVLFLLMINIIYLLIYSLTSIETTTSRKRIPDPEGGCTYFRYLGRPDSDASCPRGHKLPGKRHRIYATYNLRPKWYPYFDFFAMNY